MKNETRTKEESTIEGLEAADCSIKVAGLNLISVTFRDETIFRELRAGDFMDRDFKLPEKYKGCDPWEVVEYIQTGYIKLFVEASFTCAEHDYDTRTQYNALIKFHSKRFEGFLLPDSITVRGSGVVEIETSGTFYEERAKA